jgi:methylthioribose-1-phosphate isomerase
MSVEEFFDRVISVKLPEDCESLDIIDQTLLPGTVKRINLRTKEELWEAIKKLRVRGAPAIGVAAAEGLAMLAKKTDTADQQEFYRQFKEIADYLATSRPTAVNLFWALNRMDAFCRDHLDLPVDQLKQELIAESRRIREEDVQISRNIGAIGFKIMQQVRKPGHPVGILTHCNAGTLATAKYGTATAPMYTALEQGWAGTDMHVYCDETRPLLQGARLTSFELYNAGITTTLQCDNMVSMLMQQGRIDVVFVGCDRVAANGDAANKIGTSGVAILAKHYGVPFYVCAPSSTIDHDTPTGAQIPIEMRDPDEVTEMWYKERMAPEGVDVFNPAFDVTDHSLITGIITENGLLSAPYEL